MPLARGLVEDKVKEREEILNNKLLYIIITNNNHSSSYCTILYSSYRWWLWSECSAETISREKTATDTPSPSREANTIATGSYAAARNATPSSPTPRNVPGRSAWIHGRSQRNTDHTPYGIQPSPTPRNSATNGHAINVKMTIIIIINFHVCYINHLYQLLIIILIIIVMDNFYNALLIINTIERERKKGRAVYLYITIYI